MTKIYLTIAISISILFAYTGCEGQREHLIQGRTMGTTYHVKVVTGYFQAISGLKEKIDRRLEEINQSMSTYIEDSEISRFNNYQQVGKRFKISNDFFQVMTAARTIYRLTEGAWDGTVNPLVDLWGFGRAGRQNEIPPQHEIASRMPDIGFENIAVLEPGFLVKKRASVTLDLSSIAKGYGVDQIAAVIRQHGIQDYLAEIGGEVFAAGYRLDGKPWRIGINLPRPEAAFDDVYKVVSLHNKGFATSGDYLIFFFIVGVRYSHVIDSRTGYPVANGVAAVSIISDTSTISDGLATAIMVMGAVKGLDLINRLEGVEGLMVVEKQDGRLVDFYTKGFKVVP
jgi:thiamine biosynthesis lipoprotein